jgi:D-alanyl-D-alanine carboxypeptidase (penicillin-binding protein 5/6)
VKLTDPVQVTAEASKIGGSQVWLAEKETFPVEDLLYALMVQSANDAAVALAIHLAGSKEAFVGLMNERAQALGMTRTRFESVHGLPPGPGQKPDVTTPRDFVLLCRELLKYPEALAYTSTKERAFRSDPKTQVIMRTHNGLLNTYPGCDGLKTGYYRVAGYSIAATAQRGDRRVIAVVLGSESKTTRDAKAAELLSKGFLAISGSAAPSP